jgi:DNA-directed RNA polymerase subunit RPC12/RpoP
MECSECGYEFSRIMAKRASDNPSLLSEKYDVYICPKCGSEVDFKKDIYYEE